MYLALVQAQEAGEQPPTVRALAAATGHHFVTVQKAILKLRQHGLLPDAPKGANAVNRPTLRVVAHTPRTP